MTCAECGCLVEGGFRVATCDTARCCCGALPARGVLDRLAAQVRIAFEHGDLTSFAALLSEDARWGDDDAPNRSRSRVEVAATFRRLLDDGVGGDIIDLRTGPAGILCHLRVHWPGPVEQAGRGALFHLYRVEAGQIVEIRPYGDREDAENAFLDI